MKFLLFVVLILNGGAAWSQGSFNTWPYQQPEPRWDNPSPNFGTNNQQLERSQKESNDKSACYSKCLAGASGNNGLMGAGSAMYSCSAKCGNALGTPY